VSEVALRLPLDPALPQLPGLFDLQAIGRIAARQLAPRAPLDGIDCEIERIKYRPRRNCVIGYRVRVERGGRAAPRWERFAVAMYPGAEARERFQRISLRDLEARATGGASPAPVAWVPSLGAVIWPFPRDRKLPSLPRLCDADHVREHWLPQLVAQRWGESWRLVAARTQVVGYFPEHGCTVRSKLRLRDSVTGLQRVWTVYGQTHGDDAGERAWNVMCALRAHGLEDRGFARPLAWDAHERILWQEGVPAPTLERALDAGTADEPTLVAVLRTVAALHCAPLALQSRLALPEVLDGLSRAVQVAAAACPAQAAALEALETALRERQDCVDPQPRATVHGDLHLRNVLVGSERAWLIDLDRAGSGLPGAELGGLLADLAARDCHAGRLPSPERFDALVAGYRRHVPWALPADEARWHYAAALLRRSAYRCVTRLRPGSLEALPRVLAAAFAALERAP
jgi:hypothetical protein